MSNLIIQKAANLLRSFDWNYEYSDNHAVFMKGRADLETIRIGLQRNTIEQNNQILNELLSTENEDSNSHAVNVVRFTIAGQLARKGLE